MSHLQGQIQKLGVAGEGSVALQPKMSPQAILLSGGHRRLPEGGLLDTSLLLPSWMGLSILRAVVPFVRVEGGLLPENSNVGEGGVEYDVQCEGFIYATPVPWLSYHRNSEEMPPHRNTVSL